MNTISGQFFAGEVVHVWIKETEDRTGPAILSLMRGNETVSEVVAHPSDDFLMHEVVIGESGHQELRWDEGRLSVSLAYAFNPKDVLDTGVRVLRTTERNRQPENGPRFHYRPGWGWMNDPNGLCRIGERYHLFYQHYPHARRWNTMHWGHAVSRDLVHWVDLPVFLHPRLALLEQGNKGAGAFSGSALPVGDGKGIRVFYTDHEEGREPEMEIQATALSTDGIALGASEIIVPCRPAIPGYRKDFRDPYVFRGPDGRLKLLLGGRDGDSGVVLLYETADPEGAGGWIFVDVLFRYDKLGPGPVECPCMVALAEEGLWTMLFGVLCSRDAETGKRNLSVAVTGRFDGRRFEPLAEREIDFGTDCYAFQAYPDAKGPVGIGWAANWTNVVKNTDFPSWMTLPRRLVWRDGTLLIGPADELASARGGVLSRAVSRWPEATALPDGCAEYRLTLRHAGEPFTIRFHHPERDLSLIYDGSTLEFIDREPGVAGKIRYTARDVLARNVTVFVDIGAIEVFVDDGRWTGTRRLASALPVTAISVQASEVESETLWSVAV